MGVRRVAVAATGAALLFVGVGIGAGPVEAKRPARVTVCHVSDEGVKAITVAERAVPALLARGSALPGDPAGDNAIYGEDCSIVPVAVAGPLEQWCDNEGGTFTPGVVAKCDDVFLGTEEAWLALIDSWNSSCFAQGGNIAISEFQSGSGVARFECFGTDPLT